MPEPPSLDEQIRTNFSEVQSSAEFRGEQLWLTFYLVGMPEKLRQLAEALDARGWVNTDGWDSGLLYAKVHVEKSADAIVWTAEATQELCARYDTKIDLIDADTSWDVECSHFVTLYLC